MSEREELDGDGLVEAYMWRLPRSYRHQGYIWPGLLMSEGRLEELSRGLELAEGDVIICSYPKSGTTWVSEIVSLLLSGGDLGKVEEKPLHERVPWLEMDNDYVWVRAFWLWQIVAKTLGLSKTGAEEEKEQQQHQRRVLFTHLPLELLPANLLEGPAKLVYVARNPKDNAVSFFHFHQMARFLGQQRMEWADWLSLYTAGDVYCGDWFKHVQAFHGLAKEKPERLLFLKYEELKMDLGAQIQRIADFLSVPLTPEAKETTLKHCDFEQMKENPMANRHGVWLFNQRRSAFMRKGVVGDWRNYFTVAQSQAFDAVYQVRMSATPDLRFSFLPSSEEAGKDMIDEATSPTNPIPHQPYDFPIISTPTTD